MNKTNIPWTEKYRPTNVDDLVIDKNTYNKIKQIIKEKDMPNIIITGVPGTGKTTTILCIALQILGKYVKEAVLELNASDDRGIKTVQESIVNFCKKKLNMDDDDVSKYARHKIILLDEADNMTSKAQQLINTLMTRYHDTTRFAYTCNNSSDIIEAIQSRCIIFRYRRLSSEQVIGRLKYICEQEGNVIYTKKALEAIVTISNGDMRQAINCLATTHNGYGKVSVSNVYKLYDKPPPIVIENIFISCKNKDLKTAISSITQLLEKGYSGADITMSMLNTLKMAKLDELDEKTKIKFSKEISDTCLAINRGVRTNLQITGCIAKLCGI